MAVFQLEIADADVDRVLNAVSANYNRPETVPNPAYVRTPLLDENGDPVLDATSYQRATLMLARV